MHNGLMTINGWQIITLLLQGLLTYALYMVGAKMPPYLTFKPKVTRTSNLACGLGFTEVIKKD